MRIRTLYLTVVAAAALALLDSALVWAQDRNPALDIDLSSFASGTSYPVGVWSDGATLWVSDPGSTGFRSRVSRVYAYNLVTRTRNPGKDISIDSIRHPAWDPRFDYSHHAGALWSDGTTLWIGVTSRTIARSLTTRGLYAFNLASEAREAYLHIDLDEVVPRAIWSDGVTLWVADGKLYAYNLLTGARETERDIDTLAAAGNESPVGIWSDGTTLLVADSDDRKVYAYDLATGARDTSRDFDSATIGGDIWSDGTTLWAPAFERNHLYAYDLSTSERVADREFPPSILDGENNALWGVWVDGPTMWVTEGYGREDHDSTVKAYDVASWSRDAGKDIHISDAPPDLSDTGIWSDGQTMWIVDSRNNYLYAYDLATGARAPGKEFSLGRGFGAQGIWSDGITMWVIDSDDVLAYHLATGTRDPGKDIDTYTAGNDDPTGIWSDGTTLLITQQSYDSRECKIYAYDLRTGVRDLVKDIDYLDIPCDPGELGGLWSDGTTTLWVASDGGRTTGGRRRKLYAYHLPGGVGRDNHPPMPAGILPDRVLTLRDRLQVDLSQAFLDPDGHRLTYTAASSAPQVATVSVSGAVVTVTPVDLGTSAIAVTATDIGRLSATQTFTVAVREAPPFTDYPIRPGVTPIKALHFTELRREIDALRDAAGLAPFPWTDPLLRAGVTPIRLVHLLELRQALEAAYSAVGSVAPPLTDAAPAPTTTPVRAVHVMELRAAVLAAK